MIKRPTIIDVAKRAGVSKSTVSLVVRHSHTVKKETRDRVLKAMAETGYVYNRAAANLRMSNAGLIGLVINDLKNPFFTEFATALQMALNDKDYATVVSNTNEDPKIQHRVVQAMLEHGVSALILSPAYGDIKETITSIKRYGVPTLHVLRRLPKGLSPFPFVAPDYVKGGQMAIDHLLAQGARQIAFLGGVEHTEVTQERMRGYLNVVKDRGLDPIILTGRATRDFGNHAARELKTHFPDCDGAVCFNDLVALGLLNGCHAINHKLKVVGFDDIEEGQYAWPSLTTIGCNISKLGQDIATTVLQWLEDDTEPKDVIRSNVALIERQSSQ